MAIEIAYMGLFVVDMLIVIQVGEWQWSGGKLEMVKDTGCSEDRGGKV